MPELTLTPRSPLHGLASKGRHGRAAGPAGITIRDVQNVQIANVIARKGCATDVAKILSELAGAVVTDQSTRAGAPATAVTGIAPSQWLVTRRAQPTANLANELTNRLTNLAAIIDQSHSRIVLEIGGPNARDTLAKGVPVDLDPSAFLLGHAAQTAASHVGLQIALLNDTPTFEIITAASTAASFWSWLTASAAEYGIDVAANA
jgi:methylglutamate dehydrogenase subunit D